MNFTNTLTSNWENAFHGSRHPLESYSRSDSAFGICKCNDIKFNKPMEVAMSYVKNWTEERYDPDVLSIAKNLKDNGIIRIGEDTFEYAFLGHNDLDLAQRMIRAGSPNDKFLRQIFVSVDITAPLFFWKELDTYKVGTTANSTSTMHKLASTPITIDCFEMDDFDESVKIYDCEPYNPDIYIKEVWEEKIIDICETLRQRYNETKDKKYWKELIRILPESWLQTRTFTCNYSVLRNIIHWRTLHKLLEWNSFIDWCKTLPYSEELLFFNNVDN